MNEQLTGKITEQQIKRLLTPVRQDRIEQKQGLSYVPQQEVRAELSRTFGPGRWDSQVIHEELLYESTQPGTGTKADKTYWVVAYKVGVRLRIRDYDGYPIAEFVEYHVEENAPQPNRGEAHVLALTSAASYALRRCAIGLGDNMGLHLYNKGSHEPLVKGTLYSTEYLNGRGRDENKRPESPESEDAPAPSDDAIAAAAEQVAKGFGG
jgi:hypothetical protein